jgi:hypothetical protein
MKALSLLFAQLNVTGLCVIAALAAGCTFDASQLRALPDSAVEPLVVADTGAAGSGGDTTTTTTTTDAPSAMDGATIPTDTMPPDTAPLVADTRTPDTFISGHTSTDTTTQTTPDGGPTIPDVLPFNPDTTIATDVQIQDTTPITGCTFDEVTSLSNGSPFPAGVSSFFTCSAVDNGGYAIPLLMCPNVPGCVTGVDNCTGTRTPCNQLTTKEQCLLYKTPIVTSLGFYLHLTYIQTGAGCVWNGSAT